MPSLGLALGSRQPSAAPLLSFFRRNGFAIAAAVLGFIFLFKIGEAFLGRMSLLFYDEIGFSKTDIAVYSKGLWAIRAKLRDMLAGASVRLFGKEPATA